MKLILVTNFCVALLAVSLLSSCTKDKEEKVTPNAIPKTSFGENVKRAKDLSADSDERNDQMRSQAGEMEGE